MKKIIGTVLMMGFIQSVFAEQLTFITTMSGPVGSFSQVESYEGATAQQVTLYQTGPIKLEGNSQLGAVNLNGGTLSGSTPEFRAKELKVGAGGTVKGGRLIADKMDVASPTTLVVNGTLYGNGQTLTVNRAGATNMNITNTAKIVFDENRQPGNTLVWAANTQTPKGADSSLASQILLKSHSGITECSTITKANWDTCCGESAPTYLSGNFNERCYRKCSSIIRDIDTREDCNYTSHSEAPADFGYSWQRYVNKPNGGYGRPDYAVSDDVRKCPTCNRDTENKTCHVGHGMEGSYAYHYEIYICTDMCPGMPVISAKIDYTCAKPWACAYNSCKGYHFLWASMPKPLGD